MTIPRWTRNNRMDELEYYDGNGHDHVVIREMIGGFELQAVRYIPFRSMPETKREFFSNLTFKEATDKAIVFLAEFPKPKMRAR